MMNIRRRQIPVIAVAAAGLMLLDGAVLGAPASALPAVERVVSLPSERGVAGDSGPLVSEPRDFAEELPISKASDEPVVTDEQMKADADGTGPAGGSGVVQQADRLPRKQRLDEVVEKRTATSETYALEGGGFETEVSLVPKRYREERGEWAPVDNRVVPDPEREGVLRNAGAAWSVRFSVSGEGVAYEVDGKEFGFRLQGAADVRPVVDEDDPTVVWYRQVWPGVDVSYRVSEMAVKEEFHVDSREALLGAAGFPSEWTSPGRLIADEVLAGGLRLDWDGDGEAPIDDRAPKVSIEPVTVLDASGRTVGEAKGSLGLDRAAEDRLERNGEGQGDVPSSTRPLTVDLDQEWMNSLGDEAFPLVVDPTVNISPTTGGGTWASYDSTYGNSIGTSQFPLLGDWTGVNTADEWRFGVAFDYSAIWSGASNARLQSAQIRLDSNQYPQPVAPFNSTVGNAFYNQSYPSSPNAAAVGACHASAWNYGGMFMGLDPAKCRNWGYSGYQPTPSYLQGHPASTWIDVSKILRPWVEAQTNLGVFGVKIDTTSGAYTFHATMPTLIVNWDQPVTGPLTLTSPADGATETSLTPTMTWAAATDPDSGQNAPDYQLVLLGSKPQTNPDDDFRLSGCTTGSPILWTSGYTQGMTSASIPDGYLADGSTYWWTVAAIGHGAYPQVYPTCAVPRKFTVNRRLGASGPFPVEQLGPVGVNLITGNVVASAGTHSYATVGGGQQLGFTYNSQARTDHGLRARYYGGSYPLQGLDDKHWLDPLYQKLFADRIDPTINFWWAGGSPAPQQMDAMDNFSVRWTGYVTGPEAGPYCFGGNFDDGVRITINGTQVLNKWVDQSATLGCDTWVTFAAGETKSIMVEYFEHKQTATANLTVSYPGSGGHVNIDPLWLSTDQQPLGPGWTLATGSVAVQGATVTPTGVTLTNGDGSATEYKKTDAGAYVGPDGDGTVVRVDPMSQNVTVLDDAGTNYVFSASGELLSATAATDDRTPASVQYVWSGTPVRLSALVDPVTGLSSFLRYGGDSNCPTPPSGFTTAPGKVCSFTTPESSGRSTDLFYDSSARLSRIVQPGGITTDYAYDSNNQLTQIRDAAAFDAITMPSGSPVRANDATVTWQIGYTGSKAATVTAPAPLAGATRQVSTVTYPTAATGQAAGQWGDSKISTTGVSEPAGYSKRVRFDDTFRTRETTDVNGIISQVAYDGVSDRVSYTDTDVGTGSVMRSSTTYESNVVFNGLQRPAATYGPAPAGMFQADSPLPTVADAAKVATTITAYDGSFNGLSASWWDDSAAGPFTYPTRPAFIGAPKVHSILAGPMSYNWSTGSPDPVITSGDNWSGRLTGLINIPTAGTWYFGTSADDGARLVIDDQVMVDTWFEPGVTRNSGARTMTAGWHRISIDYKEDQGGAALDVSWLPPGGSWAAIPNANLKPDLGLQTSSASNSNISSYPDRIAPGGTLTSGQSLMAPNGAAKLSMLADGNLLLTNSAGTPLWYSGTWGYPGAYLTLGATGSLLIYKADNTLLWYTSTWPGSSPAPYLVVQNDGNLVGYQNGSAYWSSGTSATAALTPPGWVTSTSTYSDPLTSLATMTTTDSGGLNLSTTTTYEPRSTTGKFLRRTGRTLPAGATSANSYEYYGPTDVPTAPTCAGTGATVTAVAQRGLARKSNAANPTSGGATGLARSQISDATGRTVATMTTGDAKWSCTNYDTRGRPTVVTYPASAGSGPYGERTVTTNYAVGNDPFLSSITDPAGTITTRVDLLGRVTDTKDTLGIVTHTDYDLAGRPTLVTVFTSAGAILHRSGPTYNTTGNGVNQLNTQRWSNAAGTVSSYDYTTLTPSVAMSAPGSWVTLATVHYDALARIDYTDYQNGVRTTSTFDSFQRPMSVTHTKGATTLYSDSVVRDLVGRVVDRTVNGVDPKVGNNYIYDNAGRLTDWAERDIAGAVNVSGSYRFAYTGGTLPATCSGITGASVLAGQNSNRAEQSVTTNGVTVNTTYCYDYADRIQKVAPSAGTNPYSAGFAYDDHGNTTTVGSNTMSYDGANRHLKTIAGATTIEYTRDAADAIVARNVNGTTTEKYASGGLVLDNAGTVKEITINLTGGGLFTWRPSSAEVWSHGNTHGDLVITTNNTGTATGTTGSYDPFGNPLGTTSIDNNDGNWDYGWHGQAQRPLEHETNLIPTIQMGARPYQAGLGRFLAVDPVEGGTPNDYLYVAAPINGSDLDGRQALTCEQGKGDCTSPNAVVIDCPKPLNPLTCPGYVPPTTRGPGSSYLSGNYTVSGVRPIGGTSLPLWSTVSGPVCGKSEASLCFRAMPGGSRPVIWVDSRRRASRFSHVSRQTRRRVILRPDGSMRGMDEHI